MNASTRLAALICHAMGIDVTEIHLKKMTIVAEVQEPLEITLECMAFSPEDLPVDAEQIRHALAGNNVNVNVLLEPVEQHGVEWCYSGDWTVKE